ncbi:insulin-like growth factor-binding protein 3 receptor isoform X2 [Lepidochelys kempii]|uniref:insulin-like growth factor-binding protein 3 receptor isoform X2 n=1 Tax=Lepidochelys kempii TaxID=8472 RepID=UPI003C6F88C3
MVRGGRSWGAVRGRGGWMGAGPRGTCWGVDGGAGSLGGRAFCTWPSIQFPIPDAAFRPKSLRSPDLPPVCPSPVSPPALCPPGRHSALGSPPPLPRGRVPLLSPVCPPGVAMLSCPLLGSLRLCLERRPPLVCFCLCLFSLAAAFLALAAYIQWHEDWNSLLESLSHLRFCTDNGTWGGPTTLAPTPRAAPPSPGAPPALSVLVGLTFNLPGGGRPNATRLALTVTGHQLGLGGPDAQQPIRLVVVTPWPPGPSPQGSCLSLAGLPSLLPQTRAPPLCIVGDLAAQSRAEPGCCYPPQYQPDPALATMLSPEDRRLCSQRLLLAGLTALSLCALLLGAAGLCLPPARHARGRL